MKRVLLAMICASIACCALAADDYNDLIARDHPVLHEGFDKGEIPSAAPALAQAMRTDEPVSVSLSTPMKMGDVTVEWWQWIDDVKDTTLLSGVGEDGSRIFEVDARTPEKEKKKKNPLPHYAFGDNEIISAAPYSQRWSYQAVVFSADGKAQLFVNGYPIKPLQLKPLDAKQALAQITIGPDHLKGAVDEVAVYDHALSPEQIKSHFLSALHSLPAREVKIAGHRGDDKGSPENTRISYENAIKLGAKIVEMDLHLTKDHHIVLMHDDTPKRTTGKPGKVSDYTLDEITAFDAGSWKAPKYKGEPVPKIESIAATCRDKAIMMLDLKSTGQGEEIAEWLKGMNYPTSGIILAPWTEQEGVALRKYLPDPPMLLLHGNAPDGWQSDAYFTRMKDEGFTWFSINWINLPQPFIDAAHKNGMKVYAWTFLRIPVSGNPDVTGPHEIAGAVLGGVDGILTDDVTGAQKLVDELTSR